MRILTQIVPIYYFFSNFSVSTLRKACELLAKQSDPSGNGFLNNNYGNAGAGGGAGAGAGRHIGGTIVFEIFRCVLAENYSFSSPRRLPAQPGPFVAQDKFDGERMLLHKRGARTAFYSRNGKDFTAAYAARFVADCGAGLAHLRSAVLDGELLTWNATRRRFEPPWMNRAALGQFSAGARARAAAEFALLPSRAAATGVGGAATTAGGKLLAGGAPAVFRRGGATAVAAAALDGTGGGGSGGKGDGKKQRKPAGDNGNESDDVEGADNENNNADDYDYGDYGGDNMVNNAVDVAAETLGFGSAGSHSSEAGEKDAAKGKRERDHDVWCRLWKAAVDSYPQTAPVPVAGGALALSNNSNNNGGVANRGAGMPMLDIQYSRSASNNNNNDVRTGGAAAANAVAMSDGAGDDYEDPFLAMMREANDAAEDEYKTAAAAAAATAAAAQVAAAKAAKAEAAANARKGGETSSSGKAVVLTTGSGNIYDDDDDDDDDAAATPIAGNDDDEEDYVPAGPNDELHLCFVAFDILYLEGRSLAHLSYGERREKLVHALSLDGGPGEPRRATTVPRRLEIARDTVFFPLGDAEAKAEAAEAKAVEAASNSGASANKLTVAAAAAGTNRANINNGGSNKSKRKVVRRDDYGGFVEEYEDGSRGHGGDDDDDIVGIEGDVFAVGLGPGESPAQTYNNMNNYNFSDGNGDGNGYGARAVKNPVAEAYRRVRSWLRPESPMWPHLQCAVPVRGTAAALEARYPDLAKKRNAFR